MNLTTISTLIVEFFVFSCMGWIMEVILKFIQYKRFINRGFLIGPYCPIYGWGVVLVTVVVGELVKGKTSLLYTFVIGFFICGALEYFTSWYMEKRFHARWWDYSQKPLNINGRVWLGNLILFGIGSVIIIWLIDPLFFGIMERQSDFAVKLAALMIIVLMTADYAVSHFLMASVRSEIDTQEGDSTEQISKQIHLILKDKNMLIRRIHQAYPQLQARPRFLADQLKKAKEDLRQARKHTKDVLKNIRKLADSEGEEYEVKMREILEEAVAAQKKALAEFREAERKFFFRYKK